MSKEPNLLHDPIPQLVARFAISATLAYLISSLYNIVDQIFIGQGLGYLGNAATNVAYPAVIISLAISLTMGLGCSSNFNLEVGRGNLVRAGQLVTTTIGTLIGLGLLLTLVVLVFMQPLLYVFGATEQTCGYAATYLGITSLSVTFHMLTTAGSNIVRADGSPTRSMMISAGGAILNIILDPLFIFTLDMGIAGAAWATVLSQSASGIATLVYLRGFHTIRLPLRDFFRPRLSLLRAVVALGFSSLIFQGSVILVQLVTNNLLRHVGASSIYGSDIPLAVAGIVAKVYCIFTAFLLSASAGSQPIYGVNYGAGRMERVRQTLRVTLSASVAMGVVATLLFELFPRPVIALFGGGDALLMDYAVRYMRAFFSLCSLGGVFVCINTFFPAVGEAKIAATQSIVKQVVLMVPLLLLCTYVGGVMGIMWATPLTDLLTFGMSVYTLRRFWKSRVD